mmetsp:Transcript_11636/g.39766  ORF Transcript_11636/g.39766 Transcript_11636/m.39766 type:complete len:366 (-) Transcript_11636:99-1196(-)
MDRGTPTWSMARFGSGVMTVRAEKSTRLPMRLPRMRPCLPLRRSEMAFTGRPDLSVAWRGTRGELLVMRVAWWYWRIFANSATMCMGAERCSFSRSAAFALMMSASLCVRSSSLRPEPEKTPGRTCGGGMGTTLTSSHSGRACTGSNPISRQWSSLIFEKIWWQRAASTTCFSRIWPPDLNSKTNWSSSRRMVDGCSKPQPASSEHTRADWHARTMSASRRSGRFLRWAATTRSSSSSARSREQLMHTQRRIFWTVPRNPMWYTGRQSSTCPKWPGQSFSQWHVSQIQSRSIVPRRRSLRPLGFGRPFSKVSAHVTSTTDSCLSCCGGSTPNCTHLTFFTSAWEKAKAWPVAMGQEPSQAATRVC